MQSKESDINEIMEQIVQFSEDRDWDQFHSPANLAKSIVIETAELLECFQWSDEEYDLITNSNDNSSLTFKFKIVELFENIKVKLANS